MSVTDNEIREWKRERGEPVSARGPLSADVRAEYEAAHPPDGQDDGEAPFVVTLPAGNAPMHSAPGPDANGLSAAGTGGEEKAQRPAERQPAGKKISAAERFRQRVKATPKKKRPRVSIEEVVGGGWFLAGYGFARVPAMVPVGRVLMYQSGVAGVIAEDKFKGTAVDKLLQPIARAGEQGKVAVAMAGPPLIVGLMTARPELAVPLRPFLHMALATWLEIAGPSVAKAQEKAEKMAEATGGLDLDALIDSFWSLDGLPVQESAEEESAVRRARGDG